MIGIETTFEGENNNFNSDCPKNYFILFLAQRTHLYLRIGYLKFPPLIQLENVVGLLTNYFVDN